MRSPIIQRVEVLMQQSRYKEAQEILQTYLMDYPQDTLGRYYLAHILLQLGDKKQARQMTLALLADEPESYPILSLAVDIELADDLYDAAEQRAQFLVDGFPEDSDAFTKLARVKFGQRSYDKAMEYTNKALELDAENLNALNLKILIGGIIGNEDADQNIKKALNLNPENPYTIANQGLQLLKEEKVEEALDRCQYALSLDPTNDMARYAMSEAMKSKFLPYRWFTKYQSFSSKLSANGSWGFIIGSYVIYRIILGAARNNPELGVYLWPIVYIIIGLFISTWVMGPLMNCYLLTNKYGKLLLDEDDKKMASLTGGSLLLALLSFAIYFGMSDEKFQLFGVFFVILMIPLGTFLKPNREKNRQQLTFITIGVAVAGFVGILFDIEGLFIVTILGIFGYQWYINSIMIKENSRVFE